MARGMPDSVAIAKGCDPSTQRGSLRCFHPLRMPSKLFHVAIDCPGYGQTAGSAKMVKYNPLALLVRRAGSSFELSRYRQTSRKSRPRLISASVVRRPRGDAPNAVASTVRLVRRSLTHLTSDHRPRALATNRTTCSSLSPRATPTLWWGAARAPLPFCSRHGRSRACPTSWWCAPRSTLAPTCTSSRACSIRRSSLPTGAPKGLGKHRTLSIAFAGCPARSHRS